MKNVLVTGVTRGLGLIIAKRLLAEGYRVYGISRSCPTPLKKLLDKYHNQFFWTDYDFYDSTKIKENLFERFLKDVVLYGYVNNAAIAYDTLVTNINVDDLMKMTIINQISPMIVSKYVLRNMLLHRTKGAVVHITSISVHTGYKGLAMYAATKGAMEAFSKNSAREWGSIGIRSNCVAAGFMETDMTGGMSEESKAKIYKRNALKKTVELESVAGTVAFLLSEDSSSITGQVIGVDAGAI